MSAISFLEKAWFSKGRNELPSVAVSPWENQVFFRKWLTATSGLGREFQNFNHGVVISIANLFPKASATMKNNLLFCCIAIVNFASAQKISISNELLAKLLCRKWQVDFAFSDGKKIDRNQIPDAQFYELTFRADYTVQVRVADSTFYGNWCYDQVRKHVEVELHGKNVLRILSVSEKELIVTNRDDPTKGFSILPQNFTHFSPK